MSDPRGLAIARQLIEEEREKQTGRLDLGNLGLSAFPPEISTLRHLRWLSLGRAYFSESGVWYASANTIGPNVDLESWTLPTGLEGLEQIDLSDSRIRSIPDFLLQLDLKSLVLNRNSVSDLSPLAKLQSLTSLRCSGTQVRDPSPLATVKNLQQLTANDTELADFPQRLLAKPDLTSLVLHQTRIPEIPAEVLSENFCTCCLANLRAHFADLSEGSDPVQDVKVIVIGNGRIGKTQICRRLMGLSFDESVPSTHGITVCSAALKMHSEAPDATLNLWDFGGQDLYHGTHSLFMKSRAVFVVVWTPASERAEDSIHGEMRFRNQRLPYWLQYVRNLAGPNCPVLLVQNQCDTASDEEPDVPADLADFRFPYVQKVHYSARENRKRASLDDALCEAIAFLRNADGIASIGKGRMKAREQLRKWQRKDSQQPESKRRHRTVTQDEFRTLCLKAGNISSPGSLLQYLHNCGILFYRQGLFNDAIVLDQGWALEAVYAVFKRDKCYRQLCALGGRFTRSLLESMVWQQYSAEEQQLFLSMMTSCGICFEHRPASSEREAEYVANWRAIGIRRW